MFELQPISDDIVICGFNSIDYFEFSKTFSHTPEKHDFWELVYVDNGTVLAITNGVACPLQQGQVIFHEPSEIHAHISDKKVANNMLVIAFTTNSPAMQFFRKKTFTLEKPTRTLLSLFLKEATASLGGMPTWQEKHTHLDFSHAPFGATQLLQCYLTEFLIALIRGNNAKSAAICENTESRAMAQSSLSSLIADYMKQRIYSSLTSSDLCSHFMISKSHLSKLFKENMSASPMKYYAALKINEAKKLLREGRLSVGEIAISLGYPDIHNFSRAFKKSTGFSPTAYVKSIV